MNLLKDLWGHLKEWNDWKMKDWIKAGIVVVVVLIVLKVQNMILALSVKN